MFLHSGKKLVSIRLNRVGPNYEKLSDQALLWSKVVPWYKEQNETLITQLSLKLRYRWVPEESLNKFA